MPQAPTKAIAHPSIWSFSAGGLWDGGLRGLVFGCGRARGLFWAHGGPIKVSPDSESGGRSWPQPPTKAIAHPSFWAFSAGGLSDGGLPAVVFGRGHARSLLLAHGGRSQTLPPFRVQRTKFAPAPHLGYSPPLVLGIFGWGVVGRGPSGTRFWERLCPGHPAGTRRPLAKSRPVPSPADEVCPSSPPRL